MVVCVKVTSKAEFGSVVKGFTTNTRAMTLPGHGGVTFYPTPSITPTIIEQGLDEAANLEMTGVYGTNSFSHVDVIAGKWNFASIEVFTVCWDNVNLGEFLHFKGNLGEIKDYQTYFTAEGRGLIGRLSQEVEIVTSRLCGPPVHEFRDASCGHTASTVTVDGVSYNVTQTNEAGSPVISVGGAVDMDISAFSGTIPTYGAQYTAWLLRWVNGKITCTGGENSGVSREIAAAGESTGGYPFTRFYLKRPFPYDIASTTYSLVMGCNRTIEDCMIYSNIVNRRAQDFVPGIEAVTRTPSQG